MPLTPDQEHDLRNAIQEIDLAIPTDGATNARDWAGFFAGLAQLLTVLLPIILPLFLKPKTE